MSEAPPELLVVTGAAATGKSTIGDHLRGHAGLLVIDGDVLGGGAAAVSDGRRDYVAFWRHVLSIGREVHRNGLSLLVPCICLPEQVTAAADDEVVHVLALVSDGPTVQRRIAARDGLSGTADPVVHADFDASLRAVRDVPAPHTLERHDVAHHDVDATLRAASDWARRRLSPAGSARGTGPGRSRHAVRHDEPAEW